MECRARFLPGKPAGHCVTHSEDNGPSWFPTPSGSVCWELRRWEAAPASCLRGLPRSAEVWRRGSKGGKKAASPSPGLSLQCWAVTCQGLDSKEAGYITAQLSASFSSSPEGPRRRPELLCSGFLGLRGQCDQPPAWRGGTCRPHRAARTVCATGVWPLTLALCTAPLPTLLGAQPQRGEALIRGNRLCPEIICL